jgi:hypothetical protein
LDTESDNPYVVSARTAEVVLTRIVPQDDLVEIADTLERQAAELKITKEMIEDWMSESVFFETAWQERVQECERQAAENKKLRGALEFYADEKLYRGNGISRWTAAGDDEGRKARAALTGEDT